MIKFFRQIRQQMLTENKAGKYLSNELGSAQSFHGGYHDQRLDKSFLESTEYENRTIVGRGNLRDIPGNGNDENELTKIQQTIDRIIELLETAEE